jgi:hypothetical protein
VNAPSFPPTVPPVDVVVWGLRLVGLNARDDWRKRQRRVGRHWRAIVDALDGSARVPLPATISLTIASWNQSDPDGAVGKCKDPIDAISWWLHTSDAAPGLHWRIAQRIMRRRSVHPRCGRLRAYASETALRIRIEPWRPEHGDDPLRVVRVPPRQPYGGLCSGPAPAEGVLTW